MSEHSTILCNVPLKSQGLKNHAVTMFEVGKLTDEVMDSFLTELSKVGHMILTTVT